MTVKTLASNIRSLPGPIRAVLALVLLLAAGLVIRPLVVAMDADADGQDDDWELAFGLDPNDPDDALADADGDGWINLDEFHAGSDPLNPPDTANRAARLAAGEAHSLVLLENGDVWAWGENDAGQLGDATETDRMHPVRVLDETGSAPLGDILAVAAGDRHSLALTAAGEVLAWGRGERGELGDGYADDSPTPVIVLDPTGSGPLTDIVAVSAGGNHSLALTADGQVYAWGRGNQGQLGAGGRSDAALPALVLAPDGLSVLADIVAVAAGGKHSLALTADGRVFAWGAGNHGQLGDGDKGRSELPLEVLAPDGTAPLTDIAVIAAGDSHSLAVAADGRALAWGHGNKGQLGDDFDRGSSLPVYTIAPSGAGPLTDVASVCAGGDHSLAMTDDGHLLAWGAGNAGQLGDGGDRSSARPVYVRSPDGQDPFAAVIAAACGDGRSLALTSDGSLYAWGDDDLVRALAAGAHGDDDDDLSSGALAVGDDDDDDDDDDSHDGDDRPGGSLPVLIDIDNDGLPDAWELEHFGGLNPTTDGDDDGDGLSNAEELDLGTDPAEADSDGDGVDDADELARGTDPVDPASRNVTFLVNDGIGSDDFNGLKHTVEPGDVGPKKTIGAALDVTIDGDTVQVVDGVYIDEPRTYNMSGKTVTLRPLGAVTIVPQ